MAVDWVYTRRGPLLCGHSAIGNRDHFRFQVRHRQTGEGGVIPSGPECTWLLNSENRLLRRGGGRQRAYGSPAAEQSAKKSCSKVIWLPTSTIGPKTPRNGTTSETLRFPSWGGIMSGLQTAGLSIERY